MRTQVLCFFMFSMTVIFFFGASPAQAKPKLWIFGWGHGHWENLDFSPYMMPPGQPHNRQWDFKKWEPEDWKKGRDDTKVIEGFFKSDILRRQTTRNAIPVLVVGENFYNLSGFDKRRVTDLLNDVYNITQSPAGHYKLKDPSTGDIIGYYDQYGLRLR